MQNKEWINVNDRLPEKESYYSVMYVDGETDRKYFRIRPAKNIKGFMTEKKVIYWK